MSELSVYMTSIVLSSMIMGKIIEFLEPWLMARIRSAQEEYGLHATAMARDSASSPRADGGLSECFYVRFIVRYVLGHLQRPWSGPTAFNGPTPTQSNAGRFTRIVNGLGTLAPMTFYEEQCKLEPFSGLFSEYSTLIIQLGYGACVHESAEGPQPPALLTS
jgi:hypothetical protein